jgi:hypothetical protein
VASISCAAPGTCAAGGGYRDRFHHYQAFVVAEKNGEWGTALEVPGTASLNTGAHRYQGAAVVTVSCGAAGDCAAGGYYTDGHRNPQAFVVNERNGRWGTAIEVPGTAALNAGGYQGGSAGVESISCAAAGECAAGGSYRDGSGRRHAFVASETNGAWGNATAVPGMEKLKGASIDSISCPAAGDCVAAGGYGQYERHAFVVSETNGTWGTEFEVPGTDTATTGYATVGSISCASIGDCVLGGSYFVFAAGDGTLEPFVATETDGSWGNAIEVPGTATVTELDGDGAGVFPVSCAAAGECAAGGAYNDEDGEVAFVADETNGNWGNAIEVPGTGTSQTGGWVDSISCPAPGDCVAGGPGFVASQTNGRWGTAKVITLDGVSAEAVTISCPALGDCAAAGGSGNYSRAFVVNETNGRWGRARRVFPAACDVPNLFWMTISVAERTLKSSDCRLGKVTKIYSRFEKGLVVEQQPAPETLLKAGTTVSLTVSKGRRRTP